MSEVYIIFRSQCVSGLVFLFLLNSSFLNLFIPIQLELDVIFHRVLLKTKVSLGAEIDAGVSLLCVSIDFCKYFDLKSRKNDKRDKSVLLSFSFKYMRSTPRSLSPPLFQSLSSFRNLHVFRYVMDTQEDLVVATVVEVWPYL